jgi:hypothetical protein
MTWHHENGTQWVKFLDTDDRNGESCRAYVWDQAGIFHMLGYNEIGVAELPKLDGDDYDWLSYDGL